MSAGAEILPPLVDAAWFPVDLHVPHAMFRFLRLHLDVLERSTFIDNRIDAPLDQAQEVPAAVAAGLPVPQVPSAGFLFHTSFCCSTLLARALHLPPHGVALKEPLLLRRLGDARYAGWDVTRLLPVALRLLARPWNEHGYVVIKPTHAALNLAEAFLEALPDARALVLYSTLEDFLISNLKKPPETQQKVPQLADRALRAGTLRTRLTDAALAPPNLLCVVALQWAAQLDLVDELTRGAQATRVRVLREQVLLSDLPGTVARCARWLGLDAPADVLRARVGTVAVRNAKATDTPYDAARRGVIVEYVRQNYARELIEALRWAEIHLLPALASTQPGPEL